MEETKAAVADLVRLQTKQADALAKATPYYDQLRALEQINNGYEDQIVLIEKAIKGQKDGTITLQELEDRAEGLAGILDEYSNKTGQLFDPEKLKANIDLLKELTYSAIQGKNEELSIQNQLISVNDAAQKGNIEAINKRYELNKQLLEIISRS